MFFDQVEQRRAELRSGYEQGGAGNLVAELSGVAGDEADALAEESRRLTGARAVEAPYNGGALQLAADDSLLVFGNARERKYPGGANGRSRSGCSLRPRPRLYMNFHDLNPKAPRAVVVANDPPLILADKPTTNLDDDNPRNVIFLLCKSCRERGKTLIVAAHDNYATHAPDATFEMRAGTLITYVGRSEAPRRWGPPPKNDCSLPCTG